MASIADITTRRARRHHRRRPPPSWWTPAMIVAAAVMAVVVVFEIAFAPTPTNIRDDLPADGGLFGVDTTASTFNPPASTPQTPPPSPPASTPASTPASPSPTSVSPSATTVVVAGPHTDLFTSDSTVATIETSAWQQAVATVGSHRPDITVTGAVGVTVDDTTVDLTVVGIDADDVKSSFPVVITRSNDTWIAAIHS